MGPGTTAAEPAPAAVDEEIVRRLRTQRMRGDFAAIHAVPASPGEVPDQAGARLVLLGPDHPHRPEGDPADREPPACARASPALERAAALLEDAGGTPRAYRNMLARASPALERAAALLEDAGGTPRAYRNMLVFLAADAGRLAQLRCAVGRWLTAVALADAPPPPTAHEHDEAARRLVGETWEWLLAPSAREWSTVRAEGGEELAMRAGRRLRAEESLFVEYPPTRLRADLDRHGLWPAGGDHVALAAVWDQYARSVQLPRLCSSAVLAAAVVAGVGSPDWKRETFAYAAGWDAERGRFEGLVAGRQGNLVLQGSGLLVRPEAAVAQLESEGAED